MAARIARETPGAFYVNQFAQPGESARARDDDRPRDLGADGAQRRCRGLRRRHRRHASPACRASSRRSRRRPRWCSPIRRARSCADYVKTGKLPTSVGSWLVEGIGEDFVPPVCDLSRVKKAYSIPRRGERSLTCRELLRKEGIMAGTSTGTLVAAALRYCREQTAPKRVVTFVCDSGNKYLSKVYNDFWMLDQGFLERERARRPARPHRRRHHERAVATVGADETVLDRLPAHEALRRLAAAGAARTAASSASSTRRTSSPRCTTIPSTSASR